jgi:hypothetical protein
MIFVVESEHRPLSPCHPARARRLLRAGKAAVWRREPCTRILHRVAPEAAPGPLRLTIDPGSRTTGLTLVDDASGRVLWAAELQHRGQLVHARLDHPCRGRAGHPHPLVPPAPARGRL